MYCQASLLSPFRARGAGIGLLALLALGCAQDDPEPATQVVVTVSGEPALIDQLARIEARIYRTEAVFEPQPVATHEFKLPATMPLSFGVVRNDAARFLLVLEGHGPEEDGEKLLIERKVIAEFADARSMQLDVRLEPECLRLPSACRGLDTTCRADVRACSDVEQVAMREAKAGQVLAPEASVREDVPAVCRDSVCPVEYPCTPTAGGGHVCLGQFADWPMPDATPGALHPPRYDLETPGIVRDEVTGLVWQRQPPAIYEGCKSRALAGDGEAGNGCTWDEAKVYCHDLTLGGLKWRLPSKTELTSIINPLAEPAIAPEIFQGCTFLNWTSSLEASSQPDEVRLGWVIEAESGMSGYFRVTNAQCVRCVAGVPTASGTTEARYVDEADQTIRDVFTGLRWQRAVSPPLATVAQAEAYCSAAGSDFRLPTLKELLTLVDPSRRWPAVAPPFADTPPGRLWAAPASTANTASKSVNFRDGSNNDDAFLDFLANTDEAPPSVRCVR